LGHARHLSHPRLAKREVDQRSAFSPPFEGEREHWAITGVFVCQRNRLTKTVLSPVRAKAWPLGESTRLIKYSREVTFSGVAGTLSPFVVEGDSGAGPDGYSWLTGPPAYGEGRWSPREVKKGKHWCAPGEKECSPGSG
jgi:hypothetical protein